MDILTEAGFKAVFGVEKNKDVLIDLLNVLLPEHRRVHDLSYA
ncbi:MAG: PD-(D/E)XK nuclease family transposase, partial [Bacteroidetes bacterium]|nr:PD-(D/E)XK nuclease family transposase [Candidatus Cryptobacteroides excrementavium]MBO8485474.1 PD-(D/E)XK nuclease family transposase [Candidatus Cryptobacteroides excrementavium]